MTLVYLILTLCHPGRPDEVVSVATRLTPVQCDTMAALYAQDWLRDQAAWVGYRVGKARCSGKAEGSA